MTPEQFFSKNMKWFALAFFILFLFKSTQSCNRKMGTSIKEKETTHIIDSLENHINLSDKVLGDSIKTLNFQLEIEKTKASASKKEAGNYQSLARDIANKKIINTTNVRYEQEKNDSIKLKK